MEHIGDGMYLDKFKAIGLAQINSNSKINNKWTELPDCSKFGDATGALTVPAN